MPAQSCIARISLTSQPREPHHSHPIKSLNLSWKWQKKQHHGDPCSVSFSTTHALPWATSRAVTSQLVPSQGVKVFHHPIHPIDFEDKLKLARTSRWPIGLQLRRWDRGGCQGGLCPPSEDMVGAPGSGSSKCLFRMRHPAPPSPPALGDPRSCARLTGPTVPRGVPCHGSR